MQFLAPSIGIECHQIQIDRRLRVAEALEVGTELRDRSNEFAAQAIARLEGERMIRVAKERAPVEAQCPKLLLQILRLRKRLFELPGIHPALVGIQYDSSLLND